MKKYLKKKKMTDSGTLHVFVFLASLVIKNADRN